jgi:hypothetical protein
MCYRIEPKPVREGNKKMKRGKEKEKEKTCTIYWRMKSSSRGGGRKGISMQRRKQLSNIISIH